MEATFPTTTNIHVPHPPVDFAWLELTNRCNLQCNHCYTESGPTTGDNDVLTESDYLRLIDELYQLGCRKIQFIGGEPTLNHALPNLINAAFDKEFEFIEVFTNLTRLPDELMNVLVKRNVAIATSFYSHKRNVHDRITNQIGSFDRTVKNIQRVIASSLKLRVGVIIMDDNSDDVAETWEFLNELGVTQIGSDRIRKFGRASDEPCSSMNELCGSCAENILSIGPDGVVAPCNMSKQWSVGSVLNRSLSDIVFSPRLAQVRHEIKEAVTENGTRHIEAICDPKTCAPYSACCPSTQSCNPCAPNGCSPCYPKG